MNGDREGQGEYRFKDGTKYVGEFEAGLFMGKGSMLTYLGDEYTGRYYKGSVQGYGVVKYLSKEYINKYEGAWI